MSKEEQFEGFEQKIIERYGTEFVEPLLEVIRTSFYCGYAAGYAEAVSEASVFIKNQADAFNLEFSEYTQK